MPVAVPSDPTIRLRGLRRAEYERLIGLGAFEGERLELVGGVLIEMSPQGSRHAWVVERLGEVLAPLVGTYSVRQEKPFAASADSLPEPDIAVTPRSSPHAHPDRAELVIEVAETSRVVDLGEKARLYALAGVPRYWVVDLAASEVVVHADPNRDGYRSVVRHGPEARVAVLGVVVDLVDILPA